MRRIPANVASAAPPSRSARAWNRRVAASSTESLARSTKRPWRVAWYTSVAAATVPAPIAAGRKTKSEAAIPLASRASARTITALDTAHRSETAKAARLSGRRRVPQAGHR
jgi:hypothetical protein